MNDDHFDAPQLKGDFVTAIPFDNTMLPQVAGMWFGPDDYAVEVTHWINAQGPRSVTWATANGISVWIYQNTAKHFVGIGSLGLTEWEISGVRRTIQYIPMMVWSRSIQAARCNHPKRRNTATR